MGTSFIRDEEGYVVAMDENGKVIGRIYTMGDFIKEETNTSEMCKCENKREKKICQK